MGRKPEEEISKRQKALFDYIRRYYDMEEKAPRHIDMQKKLKKSHGAIQNLLRLLERKGYITIDHNKYRGVRPASHGK
jgi:SOS-response transcriptional repressor LexA